MVAEGNNKPLLFQRQGFGVECKYIEDPRRGFGRNKYVLQKKRVHLKKEPAQQLLNRPLVFEVTSAPRPDYPYCD